MTNQNTIVNDVTRPFFSRSAENSNSASGLHRANSDLEKTWVVVSKLPNFVQVTDNTTTISLVFKNDETTLIQRQYLTQALAVALDAALTELPDFLKSEHAKAGYLTAGLKKIAERPESAIEKLGKLSFAAFKDAAIEQGLSVVAADKYATKTGKDVAKAVLIISVAARALSGSQLEFLEEWGIDLLEPNRLLATTRTETSAQYIVAKPRSLEIENIPTADAEAE